MPMPRWGVAVALTQVDTGIRHPYPEIGGDTYYFWTQVYYLDSDDFSDLNQMRIAVRRAIQRSLTSFCSIQLSQFKQPPGRGNVIATLSNGFAQGSVNPGPGSTRLITVGMVDYFDSANNRFRKYYRQPLRDSDMDGDMLSASGLAQIAEYADYVLGEGVFRTLHGGLLERYQISPRVHKWQLRHGTKRSERQILGE